MRFSGGNDSLTPIDEIDGNGRSGPPSRSDLIAFAEAMLDSLRPRGSLREFSACLDLIDALHGRLTVSQATADKFKRMFGVEIPCGPFSAYALAP